MAPGAGLGQAAKAVERAMAALAKAEGEKGSGKQGAKQEVGVLVGPAGVGDWSSGRCLCTAYQNIQAAELRKWKEKAESLTQHLKARDAEVRSEASGLRRLDVMEGEIKRHVVHVSIKLDLPYHHAHTAAGGGGQGGGTGGDGKAGDQPRPGPGGGAAAAGGLVGRG